MALVMYPGDPIKARNAASKLNVMRHGVSLIIQTLPPAAAARVAGAVTTAASFRVHSGTTLDKLSDSHAGYLHGTSAAPTSLREPPTSRFSTVGRNFRIMLFHPSLPRQSCKTHALSFAHVQVLFLTSA